MSDRTSRMGNFGKPGSNEDSKSINSPGTGFRSTCIDNSEGGLALLGGSIALLIGMKLSRGFSIFAQGNLRKLWPFWVSKGARCLD